MAIKQLVRVQFDLLSVAMDKTVKELVIEAYPSLNLKRDFDSENIGNGCVVIEYTYNKPEC